MKGVLMLCCTRLFYYETFLFTACNPNLKSQLQAESWRKEAGVKSQEHKVEHLDFSYGVLYQTDRAEVLFSLMPENSYAY